MAEINTQGSIWSVKPQNEFSLIINSSKPQNNSIETSKPCSPRTQSSQNNRQQDPDTMQRLDQNLNLDFQHQNAPLLSTFFQLGGSKTQKQQAEKILPNFASFGQHNRAQDSSSTQRNYHRIQNSYLPTKALNYLQMVDEPGVENLVSKFKGQSFNKKPLLMQQQMALFLKKERERTKLPEPVNKYSVSDDELEYQQASTKEPSKSSWRLSRTAGRANSLHQTVNQLKLQEKYRMQPKLKDPQKKRRAFDRKGKSESYAPQKDSIEESVVRVQDSIQSTMGAVYSIVLAPRPQSKLEKASNMTAKEFEFFNINRQTYEPIFRENIAEQVQRKVQIFSRHKQSRDQQTQQNTSKTQQSLCTPADSIRSRNQTAKTNCPIFADQQSVIGSALKGREIKGLKLSSTSNNNAFDSIQPEISQKRPEKQNKQVTKTEQEPIQTQTQQQAVQRWSISSLYAAAEVEKEDQKQCLSSPSTRKHIASDDYTSMDLDSEGQDRLPIVVALNSTQRINQADDEIKNIKDIKDAKELQINDKVRDIDVQIQDEDSSPSHSKKKQKSISVKDSISQKISSKDKTSKNQLQGRDQQRAKAQISQLSGRNNTISLQLSGNAIRAPTRVSPSFQKSPKFRNQNIGSSMTVKPDFHVPDSIQTANQSLTQSRASRVVVHKNCNQKDAELSGGIKIIRDKNDISCKDLGCKSKDRVSSLYKKTKNSVGESSLVITKDNRPSSQITNIPPIEVPKTHMRSSKEFARPCQSTKNNEEFCRSGVGIISQKLKIDEHMKSSRQIAASSNLQENYAKKVQKEKSEHFVQSQSRYEDKLPQQNSVFEASNLESVNGDNHKISSQIQTKYIERSQQYSKDIAHICQNEESQDERQKNIWNPQKMTIQTISSSVSPLISQNPLTQLQNYQQTAIDYQEQVNRLHEKLDELEANLDRTIEAQEEVQEGIELEDLKLRIEKFINNGGDIRSQECVSLLKAYNYMLMKETETAPQQKYVITHYSLPKALSRQARTSNDQKRPINMHQVQDRAVNQTEMQQMQNSEKYNQEDIEQFNYDHEIRKRLSGPPGRKLSKPNACRMQFNLNKRRAASVIQGYNEDRSLTNQINLERQQQSKMHSQVQNNAEFSFRDTNYNQKSLMSRPKQLSPIWQQHEGAQKFIQCQGKTYEMRHKTPTTPVSIANQFKKKRRSPQMKPLLQGVFQYPNKDLPINVPRQEKGKVDQESNTVHQIAKEVLVPSLELKKVDLEIFGQQDISSSERQPIPFQTKDKDLVSRKQYITTSLTRPWHTNQSNQYGSNSCTARMLSIDMQNDAKRQKETRNVNKLDILKQTSGHETLYDTINQKILASDRCIQNDNQLDEALLKAQNEGKIQKLGYESKMNQDDHASTQMINKAEFATLPCTILLSHENITPMDGEGDQTSQEVIKKKKIIESEMKSKDLVLSSTSHSPIQMNEKLSHGGSSIKKKYMDTDEPQLSSSQLQRMSHNMANKYDQEIGSKFKTSQRGSMRTFSSRTQPHQEDMPTRNPNSGANLQELTNMVKYSVKPLKFIQRPQKIKNDVAETMKSGSTQKDYIEQNLKNTDMETQQNYANSYGNEMNHARIRYSSDRDDRQLIDTNNSQWKESSRCEHHESLQLQTLRTNSMDAETKENLKKKLQIDGVQVQDSIGSSEYGRYIMQIDSKIKIPKPTVTKKTVYQMKANIGVPFVTSFKRNQQSLRGLSIGSNPSKRSRSENTNTERDESIQFSVAVKEALNFPKPSFHKGDTDPSWLEKYMKIQEKQYQRQYHRQLYKERQQKVLANRTAHLVKPTGRQLKPKIQRTKLLQVPDKPHERAKVSTIGNKHAIVEQIWAKNIIQIASAGSMEDLKKSH